MSTNSFAHRRRSLPCVVLCVVLASACGSDPVPTSPSPSPVPSPTPTPTPPPPSTATPFNLTQSRTFDILGWDSWPSAPTPSTIQFRWNAAIGKYEVLAPGYADWSRLEARQDREFRGAPYEFDVLGSGGTKLPFYMTVWAPPHHPRGPIARPRADRYVGVGDTLDNAWENFSARAYFAFGIATQAGDVPDSGTMTCSFGEDEIGEGRLTFDRAAGTVSGWAKAFWADVRYELVQTSFAAGATTFAATFGTDGVLEGRFFGPRAVDVAVRAKGGGQGFAALRGIMTGVCER